MSDEQQAPERIWIGQKDWAVERLRGWAKASFWLRPPKDGDAATDAPANHVEYIRADLAPVAQPLIGEDDFRTKAISLCEERAAKWQRDSNGYSDKDMMKTCLIAKAAAANQLAKELGKLS